MPSPLRFGRHEQSSVEVSQALPNLARVVDDCCVIGSMHTDVRPVLGVRGGTEGGDRVRGKLITGFGPGE
jgi:hypothetical protein